jgi:DNA repair protein RecN (Recombination protein N)
MLIGLAIRDIVLVEALDLGVGPGLTALTGETGAGKSIILGALALAAGGRADAGLVRRGAAMASATAIFALNPDSEAWAYLADKDLSGEPGEDLVLRRTLSADGRSRAFVNDRATSVGVLRDLGAMLMESHGQHETVGLLDPRTHRSQLDSFGGCAPLGEACAAAWRAWRQARSAAEALEEARASAGEEGEILALRLAELDRLSPRAGEAATLAEARAMLGAAEKTLADIDAARDSIGEDALQARLGQGVRALERARDRVLASGVDAGGRAATLIVAALEAADRASVEAAEAGAAIDAAAAAFDFEPDELERAEERLFALRAMARKLNVDVEALPAARADLAARLLALGSSAEALDEARARASDAERAYDVAASALTTARIGAGQALAKAVQAELTPLKLDKARFRVAVEPLEPDRAGAAGRDRVEFEISTLPGAPFAPLGTIASGGELARFALALKASLASRDRGPQPLMIFDEIDQGVGGAVADAIGVRLKRLAAKAQVLAVTHSPQIAARADQHWRVRKAEGVRAEVDVLDPVAREEEIARMLSGAKVTDEARAAARALIHV